MAKLVNSGLIDLLNIKVLKEKVPILGVCVGMQMMGKSSSEYYMPGLNWIDADTKKFCGKFRRCRVAPCHIWDGMKSSHHCRKSYLKY